MRLGILAIALIFLSRNVVGMVIYSDTLILDGFRIEVEKDTVDLNDPNQIEYWKRDIKPLPKKVIWLHSLGALEGMSSNQFSLDSNLPMLNSIDAQRANFAISHGISWNSIALITNNIGVSIGCNLSQVQHSVLNAYLPELNQNQQPYNLTIQNNLLQAVVKSQMDQGLYELDTLSVPMERNRIKTVNIQMPLLLNYMHESKSDLWRFHGGMGVLIQYWELPAFEYTFIENRYLSYGQAQSVKTWNSSPVAILQIDRAFSNRNNFFVRCSGSWPSVGIQQQGIQTFMPNYWISLGWLWKFNNNPYIRAR